MAGEIFWKERSIITLANANGASTTTGTATAASTDLDVRASGNAAQDFSGTALLICQWATVTGITSATIVAELYAVPKIDGTNLPQIDTTSGAGVIAAQHYVGTFAATKAPSTNTDTYFATAPFELFPQLYTVYIINRSGQTISANWSLKVVTARSQYS